MPSNPSPPQDFRHQASLPSSDFLDPRGHATSTNAGQMVGANNEIAQFWACHDARCHWSFDATSRMCCAETHLLLGCQKIRDGQISLSMYQIESRSVQQHCIAPAASFLLWMACCCLIGSLQSLFCFLNCLAHSTAMNSMFGGGKAQQLVSSLCHAGL